jgi:hypothetical protein
MHDPGFVIFMLLAVSLSKTASGPSWNYCGTALNAAICQGLDSPKDYRSRKLSTEEKNVRLKTWLACFYIGTS